MAGHRYQEPDAHMLEQGRSWGLRAEHTLPLGGGWVLAPAAEYAWLLQGRAVSRLGDAGSGLATAVNHPAGGHGCLLRLDLERGRWRFGPWLQSWTLGASERVPIGRGYAAQEPGNTTREAGLGFTWRF